MHAVACDFFVEITAPIAIPGFLGNSFLLYGDPFLMEK